MIHKTTRSILSVLLAALLLVTSIPLTPAFADGGGVSPQSESAEGRALKQAGDGTYLIYTAENLKEFADIVNGTHAEVERNNRANAKLMENIDLEGSETNPWTPIGTSIGNPYEGTFNGDGHTISGLYIDSSSANYQGLFGYVDTGGTVKDLTVSGTVSGGEDVGGIVGYNSSGTVTNCAFSGNISGDWYVGGVVGRNDSGTVKNCYNTGNINGSGWYVGGVVGDNISSGSVENCYNTGEVSGNSYVGGVVGYNGGNVTNCYNTGSVKGSGYWSRGNWVGGVVGDNSGNVKNCYNTGTVSSNSNTSDVGGVVGRNFGGVTGCYFLQENDVPANGIGNQGSAEGAAAVKDLNALCNALKGDTWTISDNLNRPVLTSNHEDDGTQAHPYRISTATQLENFRDLVNGANGNPAAWAVLMENITLKSSEEWEPIGTSSSKPYSGTFDGNGHTISGLYIDSSTNDQGLFGYVSGSGKVQNLSVSGSVKGDDYVGGVVGDNRGTVENCYNTGTVTGTNDCVGGVVGGNSGSVTNCYNIGNVSGNISGGVVGYNISSGTSAIVENCYFLQTETVNTKLQGIGVNEVSGTSSNVEARTAAAFHSGEVAWLLENGQAAGEGGVVPLVWGQSNLKDKNSWPTLIALDESAQTVYKVITDYGYVEQPDNVSYTNNPATPSETPSREGYTFGGWDKTGEGNTITYTAQWTPHTYSITASPSALNFGSITEGEERPAAQTVTVKNTGNQTVTLVQPTAENFEITTSDNLTLNAGESVTLTIQPKANLSRGSYSEQITISGNDGASATLTATFTVKEPPYTGKYSYELSTSVGDHGSLTVDRYATEGEKVTITVTPDEAYKLDDLSVTANGKDVALTDNGDGTFSFTMPSADVKISATFAEDPDWTPDEPEEPATDVSDLFIDIAPDAWYKDAIQYAYDNGLMTGVSATEFAPEQTTTRAMIVSILARLEGVTTAQAAGFADVNDEWYATAVNWAANVGVVNGYEDGTFKPNTAITREQLAAILMNYAAYKGEDVSNRADLTSYTDQPSTWAEEAMSWAVAEGLINGVTADTLQPQGAATRAQVAAILQRFLSE